MYKLIAFTHNANKEDTEVVGKWLQVLEVEGGKLFNIPTHRVEDQIEENSVVITFGKVAHTAAIQYIEEMKFLNVRLTVLPMPSRLVKSPENRDVRKYTYEQLQQLKEFLAMDIFQPTVVKVKDIDLPRLRAAQVLLLEEMTKEKDRDSCFQVTKSGKLIEISKERKEDSKADLHITFSELFTIRSIMDVLGTTEVKIVKYSKEDSA